MVSSLVTWLGHDGVVQVDEAAVHLVGDLEAGVTELLGHDVDAHSRREGPDHGGVSQHVRGRMLGQSPPGSLVTRRYPAI
jgi:hypothetical protein